ncbi:MFS transporter [Rhodopila sp.]|uniref:MFS transporter n=1 Tax=Rhodopila sp. TaxID=2480087 RepID=UPI003D0B9D1B
MPGISIRLDQLPITSIHRSAFIALAFAYFFELGDLNTFAYAAPAVIREWHVNVHTVAVITSMSFAGMFLGAMSGGVLANRIGRKSAFILSVAVYSSFSLLNAVAWNVLSLALLRFLTGVGLSSMTVIANTYIGEFFPSRVRGRYMGLTMAIGLIGIPATAWVARAVVPAAPWAWRLIFIWGALGAIAAVLATRMVESPRWLSMRGQTQEAERILAMLETAADMHSVVTPLRPEPDARAAPHPSYLAVLRPPHLARTGLIGLIGVCSTLGFYGFMAWVPTLLYEHGFSVTKSLTYTSVIAICNPIGALIAADLMERIDRKWFNTLVCAVVAAAVLLYGVVGTPGLIMLVGAVVVIALQGGATGLYIYSSELFSTDVRSLGVGLTYGVGRLANVIGPLIVAALYSGFGYAAVFVFVAGCYLICAVAYGCFGPRTTGRILEAVSPSSPAGSTPARTPLTT